MIEIKNLDKTYHLKNTDVHAIDNVSLSINEGEVYGIIGYSGAGKSSLVRCINLLEVPDSGEIEVDGVKLTYNVPDERQGIRMCKIKSKELREARKNIGMIFQHFNLLDRLTVFENVAYPLKYTGLTKIQIEEKVDDLLRLVDLSEKRNVYPSQLSGGQKQRVAIARALANDPKVLLSDEATSALDPDATESILALLKKLNRERNLTIVIITHEMAVIKEICDRVAVMENGMIVEQGDVYDVFANPKQAITKKFMASTSSLGKLEKLEEKHSNIIDVKAGQSLVELQFGKESVGDALISKASRDFNIDISIVLANVETLHDSQFGRIIAIFSGSDEAISSSIEYLEQANVKVNIIKKGDNQ